MTTALILGGADCLTTDLMRFMAFHACPPDVVVACNDVGSIWPGKLDAWVTLHPEHLLKKSWVQDREANGYPPARRYYAHDSLVRGPAPTPLTHTSYLFPGQTKSGSSGLFAAKVALIDLAVDYAVFVGVPMTPTKHFHGANNWDRKEHAENFRQQWMTVDPIYLRRMKSMSGWTKEFLEGQQWIEKSA